MEKLSFPLKSTRNFSGYIKKTLKKTFVSRYEKKFHARNCFLTRNTIFYTPIELCNENRKINNYCVILISPNSMLSPESWHAFMCSKKSWTVQWYGWLEDACTCACVCVRVCNNVKLLKLVTWKQTKNKRTNCELQHRKLIARFFSFLSFFFILSQNQNFVCCLEICIGSIANHANTQGKETRKRRKFEYAVMLTWNS